LIIIINLSTEFRITRIFEILARSTSSLAWIIGCIEGCNASNTSYRYSILYVKRNNQIFMYIYIFLWIRGSRSAQGVTVHWWRYSIRIENLNPDEPVTLRERHWRIFSLSGTLETVRGKGVVGQEPRLSKQYPAFQYSSHISLSAPSGHMWG
jgi:uncharacterized protein affecting Mg2+/Co2+ transport